MFGLQFGELFIVGFVLVTVVGAPYAGKLGERIALLLHLGGPEVDPVGEPSEQAPGKEGESSSAAEERGD